MKKMSDVCVCKWLEKEEDALTTVPLTRERGRRCPDAVDGAGAVAVEVIGEGRTRGRRNGEGRRKEEDALILCK